MCATNESDQQVVEVTIPAAHCSKAEREYHAFLRMLPGLLRDYRGKYVAIHNEQVVDSDTEDIALIQRVHATIGYVPIHVGLVAEEQPIIRIPHYREYKPAAT